MIQSRKKILKKIQNKLQAKKFFETKMQPTICKHKNFFFKQICNQKLRAKIFETKWCFELIAKMVFFPKKMVFCEFAFTNLKIDAICKKMRVSGTIYPSKEFFVCHIFKFLPNRIASNLNFLFFINRCPITGYW